MLIKNLKSKLLMSVTVLATMTTASCGLIKDDLEPCPAQLRLKFVYDYNIKWADAFAHEVTSVNVWAFDQAGALVWSNNAYGPELASGEFIMDTSLTEGTYDFITWCGLKDNDGFDLATYTPASKEDLKVKMRTAENDGIVTSEMRLPGLFHGDELKVVYDIDPNETVEKTVTLSLIKDTKNIRVMLQHLDGTEINNRDFSVTITDANANYAWDNTLLPSPVVTYKPWNTDYGIITSPESDNGQKNTRDITSVASLLFELSTGRLMVNSNAILTVHRNWDNRDIIRIPLIDYLLLVKGHYGDISDQEYLDRQDDYSIVFFIDKTSNWYIAAGIYINSWAVVPPQDQDF